MEYGRSCDSKRSLSGEPHSAWLWPYGGQDERHTSNQSSPREHIDESYHVTWLSCESDDCRSCKRIFEKLKKRQPIRGADDIHTVTDRA